MTDNPYATALDGLVLHDPVEAFFAFCREREQIRMRRQAGEPSPWSQDPVFQRGRFLNVFREDDRVSKAIIHFAQPIADDLPLLVQALLFARWCNRASTLEALHPEQLRRPAQLRTVLEDLPEQPWCNVTAYPVAPVQWEGRQWSRLDTATYLFAQLAPQMTQAILEAKGDVVAATGAINELLTMENDFPIFMAAIDMAWFRPEVIDPASPVPTGIGAVAFLDRLQEYLGVASHHQVCQRMIDLQPARWPEAKRPLQPIDIEYLSCECRKYYSYRHGTKRFEGKNLFRPGRSPQLTFELPLEQRCPAPTQTLIHVIAGGPCSGKTTLLNALAAEGHRVERETAELVIEAGIAKGKTAEALRIDPVSWQSDLLKRDALLFHELPTDTVVFTDTSFIETMVFAARTGIVMGPDAEVWLRNKRYRRVFFLDPLPSYAQTQVRVESAASAQSISGQVRQAYQHYGYELVVVPSAPVAERLDFIRSFLLES